MKEKIKASDSTKKYRIGYWITVALSFLFTFCPLGHYVVSALIGPGIAVEKVAVVSSVMIVLIMTAIALVNKVMPRCRIWILMLALYFALDNIEMALILIASTQVLDELVLCPLKKFFRERLVINKQMDKRLNKK